MNEEKYFHGKVTKIEYGIEDFSMEAVEAHEEYTLSVEYALSDETMDSLIDQTIEMGGDVLDARVIE